MVHQRDGWHRCGWTVKVVSVYYGVNLNVRPTSKRRSRSANGTRPGRRRLLRFTRK